MMRLVQLGAVVAKHWQIHHGTWLLNSVVLVLDRAHLAQLFLQKVFIIHHNFAHRGIFLNIERF